MSTSADAHHLQQAWLQTQKASLVADTKGLTRNPAARDAAADEIAARQQAASFLSDRDGRWTMILRRVMAHFQKQEWAAIAIDFVIVVLGVFIGLQVTSKAGRWRIRRLRLDVPLL